MGWKLNALAFLFALWALNVGALVVGIPILLYIFYRWWSNRKPSGTGSSRWMIYVGVLFLMLAVGAVAEQGTYSPIVFGVAGIALLALALFPGVVREFAERVAGPSSEVFSAMSGREKGKAEPESCVLLTKLPLSYLDMKKSDPKETLLRFQRFAQTLAEFDVPVELRLEFSDGAGR